MFDNIGTALVQAVGFFAVFGYFVFQLLFDSKKTIKLQENLISEKVNKPKDLNKKSKKKGLFGNNEKSLIKEVDKPKKRGLFVRKVKPLKEEKISKKKGWFN